MKTVFTLNIHNYAPKITEITYPLMRRYAEKIGARFCVIRERKFPDWPVTYEKLQIFELGVDWNIFFDSDVLIHPDFFDVTEYLRPDTVMHNARDLAGNRWRYDDYFRRDGRHIGSCNWFTVASRQCLDLWMPLELSPAEAITNIFPVQSEIVAHVSPSHLVDDYALSRNIARFGLKFESLREMLTRLGRPADEYLWHEYKHSEGEKLARMKDTLARWNVNHDAVRE